MAFCNSCTGCVLGPFWEFEDFNNWIYLKSHYKDLPRGPIKGWHTFLPGVVEIIKGALCMSLFIYISSILGWDCSNLGEESFNEYGNFLDKVIYYNIALFGMRFMYYTPWCIMDATLKASGLAFNGIEKTEGGKEKYKWNRLICVSILGTELHYAPTEVFKYWNH